MFKLITDDLHLKKYFGQFSEIFGNIIYEFMYSIRDYPVLIRSTANGTEMRVQKQVIFL